MKQIYLVSIILFLTACSGNVIEKSIVIEMDSTTIKPIDTTQLKDTETKFLTHLGETSNGYYNLVNPVVFIHSVSVYSKPDTSSEIITTLPFNTSLNLPLDGYISHSDEWNSIILNNKIAFIPAYSVAAQKFSGNSQGKLYTYFVVNNYDPIEHTFVRGFTVYKYDVLQKKIIDSVRTENQSAHIAKELSHVSWRNVDFLICIKEIRAYCGGGESEEYIIDANGKLQILVKIFNYNDDGDEESSFGSRVRFPKNVATDTIIYTKYESRNIFDKRGYVIKDKAGYPKRTGYDSIRYFKWDGKALVKLGEIVNVE